MDAGLKDSARSRLTVFFEDPFWVGIVERTEHGTLSAAKVTFGAEPKDFEVYDFVRKHYDALQFSPAVAAEVKAEKKNPKRMQREARKQTQETGIGTKAQQALKLQQEQNKLERKVKTKAQKEAEEKRLYALKQQKKKEKHRGH